MTSSSGDEPEFSERLADMFFYAPLGLLWEREQVLERLAKRGRSQTQLAKLAAQMAAQRGPEQVETQVSQTLEGLARAVAGPITRVLIEAGVALGVPGTSPRSRPSESPSPPATTAEPEPEPTATAPPIEGYDLLTAREIIPLLATLDPAGLTAVREREVGGRGRKTVLTRIDQLLSSS